MDRPATLCLTPNQHALQAQIRLYPQLAVVAGYQQFTITPWSLTVSSETPVQAHKLTLIQHAVSSETLHQRTVLDLGASAGFFALWALRQGAAAATCVDMDPEYVNLTQRLAEHLQIENLRAVQSNVDAWDTPADVVFALALVHWLYSCTSVFGSLDAVIGKLASLTNHLLIVEWIEPADEALTWFGHTRWNHELTDGIYDRATFEAALSNHFVRFRRLGDTMPHRALYVAYKTPHAIDLANPLPLLEDRGEVVSSRLLVRLHGVDYWSRVYDDRDAGRVTKQGTLDLAAREARFLGRLTSGYFPRAIECESDEHWSLVVLERIDGQRLVDAAPHIRETLASFVTFSLHCVRILEELRDATIWHRDIHIENIIMREGRPVLIDFGWAISMGSSYDNPSDLFTAISDHDGVHADLFKMGLVIQAVNAGTFREISMLTGLMCDERSALRLVDLACIRSILELLRDARGEGPAMDDDEAMRQGRRAESASGSDSYGRLARTLYEMLIERHRRVSLGEQQINELAATAAEREATVREIDRRRSELEQSLQERDEQRQEADREIQRLSAEIEQRDATLAAQRAEIEQRDAALSAQRAEIEQRDAAMSELQAQLAAIQGSRAWRVAQAAGTMRRRLLRAPRRDASTAPAVSDG